MNDFNRFEQKSYMNNFFLLYTHINISSSWWDLGTTKPLVFSAQFGKDGKCSRKFFFFMFSLHTKNHAMHTKRAKRGSKQPEFWGRCKPPHTHTHPTGSRDRAPKNL